MKILVSDPIAREGLDLLRSQAEVDEHLGLKPPELLSVIANYDALLVRSETKVTAEVIQAGKNLQVIGRAGVGVDNIDVEAATRRGIVVCNSPAANTYAAAEHTIALVLALARHVPQAHASLKKGEWRRTAFLGAEVRGKVLGIVGLGRVGSEVARRGRGLDMRVIAFDPFISADFAHSLDVELLPLDELLRQADFISVHTPLTNGTRHLLGERELAMLKPTARVINVARGGIVDEEALYNAVESGRLAGAAVDVFSQEPAKDNILLRSDKIVVTPHLGASTYEAQVRVAVEAAEQVLAVLAGKPAAYAVNAPFVVPEALAFLAPYLDAATSVGRLAIQIAGGQLESVTIDYAGEVARYDTAILRSAVLSGLLTFISAERVNIVNALLVAQQRGLRIQERKSAEAHSYGSIITAEVNTNLGTTLVAGTSLRGETHIIRINEYWLDVVPTGSYMLLTQHQDKPGMIGAVGTIAGQNDINISFMEVGRLARRGKSIMVIGLDELMPTHVLQKILAISGIESAQVVKL